MYLAVILGLHSRRVIGWAVSNWMKRDLAIRALNMAIAFRSPPKGCIHHTDRGSQYCSHDYQKILRQHGFKVSMSGKGNCYDRLRGPALNTSTASTTRDADTQHLAGKARSFSNERWLKRALGAALKRDRSSSVLALMLSINYLSKIQRKAFSLILECCQTCLKPANTQ